MEQRRWERHVEPGQPSWMTILSLGSRDVALPPDAVVSVTFLERLSIWRSIINGIGTLFVMQAMKRNPGLLYAEVRALDRGVGYTLSVWEGRAMVRFRDRGAHGWAMRYLSWVFMGGGARVYFLSWLARGRIPTAAEIPGLVRQYAKCYDDGRLVRPAGRPEWPPAVAAAD